MSYARVPPGVAMQSAGTTGAGHSWIGAWGIMVWEAVIFDVDRDLPTWADLVVRKLDQVSLDDLQAGRLQATHGLSTGA